MWRRRRGAGRKTKRYDAHAHTHRHAHLVKSGDRVAESYVQSCIVLCEWVDGIVLNQLHHAAIAGGVGEPIHPVGEYDPDEFVRPGPANGECVLSGDTGRVSNEEGTVGHVS